jgi:phage terminase large subunit
MQTSCLYLWNKHPEQYTNVDPKKKVTIVNQGGTSSGKTYSIMQVLFTLAIENDGWVITVAGQDMPNLKKGAIRDSIKIVNSSPAIKSKIVSFNRSEQIYYFDNGSEIEFTSFKDFQDAQSGKRQVLFMNEANGLPYSVFKQLNIRATHKTFIDYNPTSEFWAHEKLIGKENVAFFISNYDHNPFLHDNIRDEILKLKDEDPQLWRVYGLGQTGKIEGLVFNWRIVDEMPKYLDKEGYGMDFGFSNDPTTLMHCGLSDGEIYIDEIIYQKGLTNSDINKLLIDNDLTKRDSIIADSADPKSIKELRLYGWNITGADKGADSILYGISLLKQYGTINITKRSYNMLKEAAAYKWKISRDGEKENKPIDAFNHGWDAVRYWALGTLGNNKGKKILAYG